MPVLLQIDFKMDARFLGERLSREAAGLAESINAEPGFISKIWTEDVRSGEAGGVYLFSDRDSAGRYLAMHQARVAAMGATDIRSRIFDINETLTRINHGSLGD